MVPVPAWLRGYRREWLPADVVAGLVIWGVVVPQAVAYAQIAGLPPQAGLVAAPGAMLAYALLGSSRTLVVSATTATSALSAAAVAPLADGDAARFAALSAGLALVAAVVLVAAGFLRLGAISDLVSTPVMTGFLFGLGLTIAVDQLPKVLGVPGGDGGFFDQVGDLLGELDDIDGRTAAVGLGSIALLVVLPRLAPAVPATLVVLGLAIALSWLLDLRSHGVDVVGELPDAFPHPELPDVSLGDLTDLVPAALGVMFVTAEAVGVARSLATEDDYAVDSNRELVALGASNLAAALSPGFVQSGGASQTAAAQRAGGRSQLASVVAAGLILLTGLVLAPLFEHLPQATLGAIVVVAVAGFLRGRELVRIGRIRTSAVVLASVALAGVLVLGVLPGLLVAAGLSLAVVIQKLSRPSVGALGRDPATGAFGRLDRHEGWETLPGLLLARVDGPLLYANSSSVKDRLVALARSAEPPARVLVLELAETTELDVESADMLADLRRALERGGVELRLAAVRAPALALLGRSGLTPGVAVEPTLALAVERFTRTG